MSLQAQPYDHVLTDDECANEGLMGVVEYIARNPERAKLVGQDQYRRYPYSGCLIPGYPELELCLWKDDYWKRFWRTYAFLRENGMMRLDDGNQLM